MRVAEFMRERLVTLMNVFLKVSKLLLVFVLVLFLGIGVDNVVFADDFGFDDEKIIEEEVLIRKAEESFYLEQIEEERKLSGKDKQKPVRNVYDDDDDEYSYGALGSTNASNVGSTNPKTGGKKNMPIAEPDIYSDDEEYTVGYGKKPSTSTKMINKKLEEKDIEKQKIREEQEYLKKQAAEDDRIRKEEQEAEKQRIKEEKEYEKQKIREEQEYLKKQAAEDARIKKEEQEAEKQRIKEEKEYLKKQAAEDARIKKEEEIRISGELQRAEEEIRKVREEADRYKDEVKKALTEAEQAKAEMQKLREEAEVARVKSETELTQLQAREAAMKERESLLHKQALEEAARRKDKEDEELRKAKEELERAKNELSEKEHNEALKRQEWEEKEIVALAKAEEEAAKLAKQKYDKIYEESVKKNLLEILPTETTEVRAAKERLNNAALELAKTQAEVAKVLTMEQEKSKERVKLEEERILWIQAQESTKLKKASEELEKARWEEENNEIVKRIKARIQKAQEEVDKLASEMNKTIEIEKDAISQRRQKEERDLAEAFAVAENAKRKVIEEVALRRAEATEAAFVEHAQSVAAEKIRIANELLAAVRAETDRAIDEIEKQRKAEEESVLRLLWTNMDNDVLSKKRDETKFRLKLLDQKKKAEESKLMRAWVDADTRIKQANEDLVLAKNKAENQKYEEKEKFIKELTLSSGDEIEIKEEQEYTQVNSLKKHQGTKEVTDVSDLENEDDAITASPQQTTIKKSIGNNNIKGLKTYVASVSDYNISGGPSKKVKTFVVNISDLDGNSIVSVDNGDTDTIDSGFDDNKKNYTNKKENHKVPNESASNKTGGDNESKKFILDVANFKPNEVYLTDTAKSLIKEQAQKILDIGIFHRIIVKGHADNTGSKKINASVSFARARAVYDELKKNGIPEDKMKCVGMSDVMPVDTNSTEEGKANNRRTEIFVEL
ncbi:MAG: OmpA family protein [Elusimicrobiota bacterium]|jgi:outer membrane protein OmpA-like peptidoglycan-associated protein|nr:OmpA family protein [Elusimicrobiota bacterium]